jgi:hypothetical protein
MAYETPENYVDTPDSGPRRPMLSKLLQATSPMSDYPGAKAGDFAVAFADGTVKVFPGSPGVTLLPLMFFERSMEWPLNRGASAPPVEHDRTPLDAQWLSIDATGRRACLRPNGNRIERTIYLNALFAGLPTTFSFRSTAYSIGDRFMAEADSLVCEVDGKPVYTCVAFFQLFSEQQKDVAKQQSWHSPRFKRLGVLGEPTGPTLEEVREARSLRIKLKLAEAENKQRLARERIEAARLSMGRSAPMLDAPGERPRGSVTIESGRHWADPNANNPGKPEFDDDIPWK